MDRRKFIAIAAATPALAASSHNVPVRKAGKVEIVFDSPGPQPNGLQATDAGLWIIDQSPGSKASLVSYGKGQVLRSFNTETDRSSGITFDGESLWIGSTYSREIVRVDANDGRTLERHFTPGAGVIYQMAGDPTARSSPLLKTHPRRRAPDVQGTLTGGYDMGRVLGGAAPGTGAHGQEWRDGRLWFAVPPSREVYCVDPKTWIVQAKFGMAGNRPHGIGWEDRYLWVTDSNLNAFFKHDPASGEILERIQLGDSDPLPHGMTIWQGTLWYCDDVGVVCRFRMQV